MNPRFERLRKMFQDEDARYAYADSTVNAFISAQIRALREKWGLSQEELAVLIGTKQSGISRLEKADYSAWKVETLRKLARAFHVRLRVSFEEFGTLPNDLHRFDTRNLTPRKFEEDPAFKEPAEEIVAEDVRIAATATVNEIVEHEQAGIALAALRIQPEVSRNAMREQEGAVGRGGLHGKLATIARCRTGLGEAQVAGARR